MKGILEYGIEVIGGRPGSGKSYFAVYRMLRAVEATRRPVYTNLPLRFRVVSKYLSNRPCGDLSTLVRPLSKEQMFRFLDRAYKRQEISDELKHAARLSGDRATPDEIEAELVRRHGPSIILGDEQNWIPPGSIIIIDEAHHWFRGDEARKGKEPPQVLSYLSLIRHHMHWLWFITQSRNQLSVNCRRPEIVKCYWDVCQIANERIMWGLRFKHLGITGLSYAQVDPDREEGVQHGDDRTGVTSRQLIFPWLPWHRWRFRLYDSFTHVGSPAQIAREIAKVRQASGLTDDGHIQGHNIEDNTMKPKRFRRLRFLIRWIFRLLFWMFLAGYGYWLATQAQPEITTILPAETVADMATTVWLHGELQAIGLNSCVIGGKRYAYGSRIGDYQILTGSLTYRSVLLLDPADRLHVLERGKTTPKDFGSRREIVDIVRAARARYDTAWPGSFPELSGGLDARPVESPDVDP